MTGDRPQLPTTAASCVGTWVSASAEFIRSAPMKIRKIIADASAVA